jgi:hypothetical protein
MPPRQRAAGTEMYNTLRSAILSGALSAGDYLPGTPELRIRFGISNDTAQRVLTKLSEEKLIIRRNGCPTKVATLPLEMCNQPLSIGLYLPRMGGEINVQNSPLHFNLFQSFLELVSQHEFRMPVFPASKSGYDFSRYGLDGLIIFSPPQTGIDEVTMLQASGIPLLLLEAQGDCWNSFNRISTDRLSAFFEVMKIFEQTGHRKVTLFASEHELVKGHISQMYSVWQSSMLSWGMEEKITDKVEALAGDDAIFSARRLSYSEMRQIAPEALVISYVYSRIRPESSGRINICHSADLLAKALQRMKEIIAAPLESPRAEWVPATLLTSGNQSIFNISEEK